MQDSLPGGYPSSAPAPSPGTHGPGGGGGLDWRQLWQTLLEKGWVVILLTLTGLFLAWGYLARSPKLYQSHAVLEVQTQEAALVDVGNGTSGGPRPGGGGMFGLAGQEALHTIEQNLRNRALMVRVLKSENLLGVEGARTLLSTPKVPYTGLAVPEESMANVLGGMVTATIRRGTRLIDVFVTHADPVLARRLADAVGREFIRMNIEHKQDFYQASTSFLLQEAARLKENLQKSERAVSDYKANTPNALSLGGSDTSVGSGGGGPGGGGRSSAGNRLEELSAKLNATKADRVRLESDMAQIEAAAARGGVNALLAFPVIANAPTVAERRRELAQIQGAVAQLAQRYKDKHPKMMSARVALDGAQAALTQAVLAEPGLLRTTIAQAKANEEGLENATKQSERDALDLNRAAIGYQELARQADTDRVLYENIIGQIKRTGLAMEANRSDAVSIVERASQPGGPVSPQPTKAILAGVLGGLLAGLGLVGLLAALDRTVKTVEQAEGVFGLPVLAAVPEVEGRERRRQRKEATSTSAPAEEAAVVAASAPEGPVAEAFRSLRAALALLGPEDERRVVLMTSALPSEGKSFTSANLAIALAQQGQRVLLIDGDLRRPTQGRLFFGGPGGDNGGDLGVIDYLLSGSGGTSNPRNTNGNNGSPRPSAASSGPDIMALVRPVPLPGPAGMSGNGGLWLLPAGRRAPNPAELLGSGAGQAGIARMINASLQHFDRVVIDSAPLLAVSDTLLLLPYTQTILVVVHARKTSRAALARGLTLLAQAATGAGARAATVNPGAPSPAAAAGLILNRLPRRRGLGYYYYYGQEYSYGQLETREATRRETTPTAGGGNNGRGHLSNTR